MGFAGHAFNFGALSAVVWSASGIFGYQGWLEETPWAAAAVIVMFMLWLNTETRQPKKGAVFITGADSGMGNVSAVHLAQIGYDVYAGCYAFEASKKQLAEQMKTKMPTSGQVDSGTEPITAAGSLTCVALDVTKEASIDAAYETVKAAMDAKGQKLISIINCAGVGYNGPIEYMPLKMYREQMEVNYFGYVAVTQKFLPLVKATVADPESRRGRVIFVGTGGGPMSPAPALLSAYMGSKWAGEAFIQVLRVEMALQNIRIDAAMVNPGFIKPTALMDGGIKLIERLYTITPAACKAEYEWLFNAFIDFSEKEAGTHPSVVATTMEEIMSTERPGLSYKVGPDSAAAPFVGLTPTKFREWVIRASMYKKYFWTPK